MTGNTEKMDKLDLDILKQLLANNGTPPGKPVLRRSFRSMAKDLGVDQGTVRGRIRKFQEGRILRGWYLGLSPSLTGEDVIYAWLTAESENQKDRLAESLASQPGVERVCSYLGPKLSLILFHTSGSSPDEELRKVASAIGPENVLHMQAVVHLPRYELKMTDASIIDVLRRDPWQPYESVARELGLSSKTVKRRVSRLAEDGMIYMLPVLDLKALHGVIPMELVVEYTSAEAKVRVNESITGHVKENLVFSDTAGPVGYFAVAVPTLVQVEEIAKWSRQLKGVKNVHSGAILDVALSRNYYERPSRLMVQKTESQQLFDAGMQRRH
jgi:DNA-binding Lrp family transcriptional regulator